MANELTVMDMGELERMGAVFVKSHFFADTTDAAQAIVKIMAGRELGIAPIASMTGIYIVKGKPSLSANLIATKIKASGKYNYRVRQHTAQLCEIEYFERDGNGWQSIGVSSFTFEDARKAGTQNLDKYPRNMLFARAMSNGAKWYCPDAFAGIAAYVPEELGADVNDEGEVIDAPVITRNPNTAPTEQDMIDAGTENEPFDTLPPLPDDVQASVKAATARHVEVPSAHKPNGDSKRKQPPISQVQTNKIKSLYEERHGVKSEIETLAALNDLFQESYHCDMKDATYEQAARMTGYLLSEIRNAQTA